MSLLLDALKKSGPGTPGQTDTGELSELSLEALPSKQADVQSTASPHAHNPSPSPRSASENMFNAKKAPPRKKFQYNLGLVPTAAIIGLVLATAGSIYVWYEIQPPKAAVYRPTNVASAMPTPAPQPMPSLPIAAEPPFATESSAQVSAPAPVAEKRTEMRRTRPANISTNPPPGIQIQKRAENDQIYNTVLAAYQAYQNGDYAKAWQQYREVLIRNPKHRDALLGMAAIAQQQNQDDTAKQYYNQVLALDPRDPVALAGMSNFSTADAAGRESKLRLSLSQTPNSAALHFALGNLYTDQSRWGEAQEAYFNAFKIEPGNAEFAFHLATSLDHLGQSKIAANYYRQALQLDTKGIAGFNHAQTEKRLNQLTAH